MIQVILRLGILMIGVLIGMVLAGVLSGNNYYEDEDPVTSDRFCDHCTFCDRRSELDPYGLRECDLHDQLVEPDRIGCQDWKK